jgi:hypothetical protein
MFDLIIKMIEHYTYTFTKIVPVWVSDELDRKIFGFPEGSPIIIRPVLLVLPGLVK